MIVLMALLIAVPSQSMLPPPRPQHGAIDVDGDGDLDYRRPYAYGHKKNKYGRGVNANHFGMYGHPPGHPGAGAFAHAGPRGFHPGGSAPGPVGPHPMGPPPGPR